MNVENNAVSAALCNGLILGYSIRTKHQRRMKIKHALPILKTSAKSVQTTAEVCADYTCSLYRLQLKSPESTTYLQI